MGEGEGGGGQDEDLLGPPSPSSPPTEGRGDFVGICLFNYGLLNKSLRYIISNMRSSPKEMICSRPLHPDVLDAGLDLLHALRRTIAFAMDIAGMLHTVPHQFFGGLGPNHEIAIRPEISASQLLILF